MFLSGGALIGILTLRDVREGEELLIDYGKRSWQERKQHGDKTKPRNSAGDV
jgi:SET domain-containing protein